MSSASSQSRRGLPVWMGMLVARVARRASRLAGRGATSLPGKVLCTVSPQAIAALTARIKRRRSVSIVCISATNGKTTSATMLADIARQAGLQVRHNAAGANLRSGIATLLMDASPYDDVIILETDEAALPSIVADVEPDVIALGNIFRDQLDRYGELDVIATRWHEMLHDTTGAVVVANIDDEHIAYLMQQAPEHIADHVVSIGIDAPGVGSDTVGTYADATACHACGTALTFAPSIVGHLGNWSCPGCSRTRETPSIRVSRIDTHALAGSDITIDTPDGTITAHLNVPGTYNAYNAALAAAIAHVIAVPSDAIASGLAAFHPAFGRFERLQLPDGTDLTLILAKNPTGLSEVCSTIADAGVNLDGVMMSLNDRIADGRDTSWVWDADVGGLADQLDRLVVTGDRADEMALRMTYAGLPLQAVTVMHDVEHAVDELVSRAPACFAILTYTSLLDVRRIVERRGWSTPYWQATANDSGATPAPGEAGA